MIQPLALDPRVRDLATVVKAALSGDAAGAPRIDAAMAGFAIHRHRCGPLVALAARNGVAVDEDAKALLDAHWDANRHTHLRNLVAGERIAAVLAGAGIPGLSFKGAALAKLLYPEPLSRHCGDVDVLVPPASMLAALEALTKAGLRSGDPLLGLSSPALRMVLGLTRDIAFDDGWTQSHVELHSRLLFSKRLSQFLAAQDETLRSRAVGASGQLPAPALGPGLALYLILHGCVSGWGRLKWLADLIPLLDRLGPEGRQQLADAAERSGTAGAVKASLALLRATFGPHDLAPLDRWIGEAGAARYAEWLCGEEAAMPVASRGAMLQSVLMLDDRATDRTALFFASSLSSGVRRAAGALGSLRSARGTQPAR